MKITNPIEYMSIGGRIRYLIGQIEGNPIFGTNYILYNLKSLRLELEKLGFKVSCNLYDNHLLDLENKFSELLEAYKEDKSVGFLTVDQYQSLRSLMLPFESTVFAEAKTRIIASPIPRRFAIEHLLSTPEGILGSGVFDVLPDLAKSDISYACRCIAFECATAAVFHMLRAIEGCVRVLYKSYYPGRDERRSWGTLTTELNNKPRRPKPDDILLAHLDHLRTRFRNPTDHPEKIYEIEETEDLVHMSVDIVNRCMHDPQVEKKR